jgi:hypothetical protein
MYATESMKQWFAPGNQQEILLAGKYLEQSERRASKLPYLLDHGATKMAAKVLRKARESFTAAHSVMNRVKAEEEQFRLKVTEEIHLS